MDGLALAGGSLHWPLRAAFGTLSKFEGNFVLTGKIDYRANDMYMVRINAHGYTSSIYPFEMPNVFSYAGVFRMPKFMLLDNTLNDCYRLLWGRRRAMMGSRDAVVQIMKVLAEP